MSELLQREIRNKAVRVVEGGNSRQESVEALLKQADLALYQAKEAGRNTVRFFNPAM